MFRAAAADTVQDGYPFRQGAILKAYFPGSRPAGINQTLQFHPGYDIFQFPITVLGSAMGIEIMEAGGQ